VNNPAKFSSAALELDVDWMLGAMDLSAILAVRSVPTLLRTCTVPLIPQKSLKTDSSATSAVNLSHGRSSHVYRTRVAPISDVSLFCGAIASSDDVSATR
jgi:hypothetical protein